jgi:hypothetical protein
MSASKVVGNLPVKQAVFWFCRADGGQGPLRVENCNTALVAPRCAPASNDQELNEL